MLYMIERFSITVKKQHEDEPCIEEMHHKEIYYAEAKKRNEDVQKLKHDLKNKLFGLYHLIVAGDTRTLLEQVQIFCKELEQIDADSYTANPSVDTVLRIKLGLAKAEGIKVDFLILIPKRLEIDYGDIGVLYGNLLDNAIEACKKIPEKKRFIRVENKYHYRSNMEKYSCGGKKSTRRCTQRQKTAGTAGVEKSEVQNAHLIMNLPGHLWMTRLKNWG